VNEDVRPSGLVIPGSEVHLPSHLVLEQLQGELDAALSRIATLERINEDQRTIIRKLESERGHGAAFMDVSRKQRRAMQKLVAKAERKAKKAAE
jgi:hypothetical protein